jgi:hypothetical protein
MRVYTGRYVHVHVCTYTPTWVWMMNWVTRGQRVSASMLRLTMAEQKDTTCYTNLCVVKHIPTSMVAHTYTYTHGIACTYMYMYMYVG